MMVSLVLLAIFVPIIAIVSMIVVLAKKDEETAEKRVRTVYLYIIAFATLIMTISGIIGALTNAVDLILPDYENGYYGDYNLEEVKNNYYARNTQELIDSLGVIVVSLPVFVFHGKKARELKED